VGWNKSCCGLHSELSKNTKCPSNFVTGCSKVTFLFFRLTDRFISGYRIAKMLTVYRYPDNPTVLGCFYCLWDEPPWPMTRVTFKVFLLQTNLADNLWGRNQQPPDWHSRRRQLRKSTAQQSSLHHFCHKLSLTCGVI